MVLAILAVPQTEWLRQGHCSLGLKENPRSSPSSRTEGESSVPFLMNEVRIPAPRISPASKNP